MNSMLPIIGALAAAAITPEPNNLIVMQAAARSGIGAAGRAIAGVVSGSLVLLVLVSIGLGAALRAMPALELVLSVVGSAYLAWLGVSLLLRNAAKTHRDALPSTLLGIAVFQLLNPKAWILVATTAAAMRDNGGFAVLALIVVLVTSTCLSVWALAGAAAARLLQAQRTRNVFDRSMGAVLVISAAGLLIDALAHHLHDES